LVEFTLVTPLLLLLMAAVLNYGLLLRTSVLVADAARAGAQYGSRSPANATDTAGIQTAARNSTPDVANLTVTSARTCQCGDGTAVSCTTNCARGTRMYVQVTASATGRTVFSYAGLPFGGKTSSQATMRIQ
jgi:Flp pilus assembly protein TadG